MLKHIVFALCGCLYAAIGFAQTNQTEQVLRAIEQNNKELKAFQSLMESQRLDYKSSNNLPDPQVSAFYLPFGEHTTGDYSEFQVSQSFEFPTVYAARGNWIDKQEEQLQLEYSRIRQEVLLPAKKYCIDLISLAKRKEVVQLRMEQARQVFEQVQELFDKEQVGILQLNKAKIAWMQDQFQVEQIEAERRNLLLSLQKLNGGQAIVFDQKVFATDLKLSNADSLWQQKKATDPEIVVSIGLEDVSMQQIKVEKNKLLPNLTAGFNHQGVMGSNYSGVYGGISIPLWSGRNKVKAAEARYQYQQSKTEAVTTAMYSTFLEQYNQYELMLRKYDEYTTTLEGLNSENLLLEAYQLGQISFMDYYIELQFYRQAYDKMLEIEKELHQLKAEILKYQL
ncbi:TolC family protein [Fulvivirga kasyanovii]|uniref:Transporter n=2 Tax=Cytophagales TaxID=768507 RepID=A0ABQ1MCS0_9BACT|nr:TolC family protein [Fulvivirga kasyanovii]MBT32382.1 transporter [Thalassovita sp.]MTI27787.1 TolC family protein [Fulvivirga kasyanovii]GGC36455.1 transporter [Marivirga lumbricoides]